MYIIVIVLLLLTTITNPNVALQELSHIRPATDPAFQYDLVTIARRLSHEKVVKLFIRNHYRVGHNPITAQVRMCARRAKFAAQMSECFQTR